MFLRRAQFQSKDPMIGKSLKALTPYGLIALRDRYRRRVEKKRADDPDFLFDGDDELFKRTLRQTHVYGEYGCGKSTSWVLRNCDIPVVSVDTSRTWVETVKAGNLSTSVNLDVQHIDLGDVGTWGRPVGYAKRKSFHLYTDSLWRRETRPDTVLIDGRFRVCCFFTVLKYAAEGTKIIFDDYTIRPYYHVVEDYVPRQEVCGRQALFLVPPPGDIDTERLEADIAAFRHVMD